MSDVKSKVLQHPAYAASIIPVFPSRVNGLCTDISIYRTYMSSSVANESHCLPDWCIDRSQAMTMTRTRIESRHPHQR